MHRFLGKTMIRTLAVALCTAGGAWADVTTVQTNNGDTMTYEYEGDKLRIDVGQQDSYMLLVDGTVYSVTRSDGEYMVVDVSQAMSMFGSALRDAAPGAADSRVESFEATGRKETIAGIEGEVYLVKYIDHEGKAQQGEDAEECEKYAKYYRSLCPTEWVEKWNEEREAGTWPGRY